MIRVLAKFLIQRAYDDASDRSVDPLPNWLRRWIRSDVELQRFEASFVHLETVLKSQSKSFLPVSHGVLRTGKVASFEKPNRISTAAWLAMAAGISAITVATAWWQSMNESDTLPSIAVNQPNVSDKHVHHVVNQSLQFSKRWTDKLSKTNTQVSLALATINENTKSESEQLQEAGRNGLKFIAHTIPASTVRMFGVGR